MGAKFNELSANALLASHLSPMINGELRYAQFENRLSVASSGTRIHKRRVDCRAGPDLLLSTATLTAACGTATVHRPNLRLFFAARHVCDQNGSRLACQALCAEGSGTDACAD